MTFLNELHKQRYEGFLKKGSVHQEDLERKALFYIISGNDILSKRIDELYDFQDGHIKLCKSENVCGQMVKEVSPYFSSSEKALIRLGYNLFNGFADTDTTPFSIFIHNKDFSIISLNAIIIRFGLGMTVQRN